MADAIRLDGPRASFTCPACKIRHTVMIAALWSGTPVWQWNGDKKKPTFRPSILVRGYHETNQEDFVCHSFVTDGCIEFLNDCTHQLAGKTVALSPEARP